MAFLHELTDTFPGTALGSQWATLAAAPGDITGQIVVTGGELVIDASTSYPHVYSVGKYDLIGSFALVRLTVPPAGNGSVQAFLQVRADMDSDNSTQAGVAGGRLLFGAKNAGTMDEIDVGAAPAAGSALWLRIRHAGGTTLAMDTSPDGTAWAEVGRRTISWTPAECRAFLVAGRWDVEADDYPVAFDNFNVPPTDAIARTAAFSGTGTLRGSTRLLTSASFSGSGTLTATLSTEVLPVEYRTPAGTWEPAYGRYWDGAQWLSMGGSAGGGAAPETVAHNQPTGVYPSTYRDTY